MEPSTQHSVTQLIEGMKQGEPDAFRQIWERYFQRLMALANKRLGGASRRVADEEDVAVSAIHSLFEGAAAGRFEKLQNRTDLWSLLVAIASHKAVNQIRRQVSQKRGAGEVRGDSIFIASDGAAQGGFEAVIGGQPTPEFLVLLDEENRRLFELLRDDRQREIARLRLAGYSNEEIAEKTGISLRSVERKLAVIRGTWSKELEA